MAPTRRSESISPARAGTSAGPPQALSSLAAFAAEMVTWLWFAQPEQLEQDQAQSGPSLSPSSAERPRLRRGPSGVVSKLQVNPQHKFLTFMNDILQTTQVSHSVVILSLLYISRLKGSHSISPLPGSEYRLTVTALMIANKVLDDNTYTAKTWAEVSLLELDPLVAGEAEFLKGLNFSLHVSGKEFESWIRLLEGHVSRRNAQIDKRQTSVAHNTKRVRIDRPRPDSVIGLGLEGLAAGANAIHRLEVAHVGPERAVSLGAPPLVRANSNSSVVVPHTPCASHSYPTPHTDFLSPHAHFNHRSLGPSTAPHATHQRTPPFVGSHSAPPKRRAGDAFDDSGPPPPFPLAHSSSSAMGPANKRLQSAFLGRSYSAGAEVAPIRAIYPLPNPRSRQPQLQQQPMPYLHPSHNFDPSPTEATFAHRRQQALAAGGVPSLAEANSPRYDARPRREQLSYYSLGQERERGGRQPQVAETVVLPAIRPRSHSRTLSGSSQPRPGSSHSASSGYAPAFPSHLSISTSPNDRIVPRSVGASPLERGYSNEGYVSFAGQTNVQQNVLPLPLQRAPQQFAHPSSANWGFANAGPPGICWGVSPRALEAQGWQSFAPGVRSSTP